MGNLEVRDLDFLDFSPPPFSEGPVLHGAERGEEVGGSLAVASEGG